MKSHQLNPTLNGYFSNQFMEKKYATGAAKIIPYKTSLKKSPDISNSISVTDAPFTLRIPISFVRWIIMNQESPNKPKQAITIARMANKPNMVLNCFSA
jgi:hypothetical protein